MKDKALFERVVEVVCFRGMWNNGHTLEEIMEVTKKRRGTLKRDLDISYGFSGSDPDWLESANTRRKQNKLAD